MIKKYVAIVLSGLALSGCSSIPSFSFFGEKPVQTHVEREPFLKPTREKLIVADVSLNANAAESTALLGGLAESAGFTYKQAYAFKVTAKLQNTTVENAIAQLAVAGNKIAIINYQARAVTVLDVATLSLKMPKDFASRLQGLAGVKTYVGGQYAVVSVRGSGSELNSVIAQVRRLLEEDMTKVEVSMEA